WCISRQLWWGHRIPVWYCGDCGAVMVSEEDVSVCTQCGSGTLSMDQDVLDTWFSSGLWPFSTMGWPERTEDLETFYPTAVLVTGYDILFFWVARMAMLGIKFMEQVPFRQVLLHGLLRDQHGEKMSKTKGNGLDPLEMVERFGADALRFALAAGTVLGRDMVLQESTIEGYRNFINKLWNAARFASGHIERLGPPQPPRPQDLSLFDRWIGGRLSEVAVLVNRHLEARRFNEAAKELYGFVWHELCDWYVEIVKPVLYGDLGEAGQAAALGTLHHTLTGALRLLHPIMPFVTEELWHRLAPGAGSIMLQPYPTGDGTAPDHEAMLSAGQLVELIQAVRTIRGEHSVKPRQAVDIVVVAESGGLPALIRQERDIIHALAGIGELTVAERFAKQEGYGWAVGRGFEVFVSLKDLIDVAQERQRIGREREKTASRIQQLSGKLDNPAFVDKAPAHVVARNREELLVLQSQLSKLDESLSQLS
ncbi:MAG: class I tRNA ligase family protein, partial [Candidatus Lambdaproteobacteria bacterium]|nr:class I tRNA ligase family protein [Candidatus Lambdaproteobacteria bacterium]